MGITASSSVTAYLTGELPTNEVLVSSGRPTGLEERMLAHLAIHGETPLSELAVALGVGMDTIRAMEHSLAADGVVVIKGEGAEHTLSLNPKV